MCFFGVRTPHLAYSLYAPFHSFKPHLMNDPVPPSPVIHSAFKIAFKVVSHLFFREIKTTGEQLVPVDSPCIFIVGPHANQFVDGMVFLSNVPRHSYAIMASVSYNKPFIGHVGKILSASK